MAIEFAPEIHEPMVVGVRVRERWATKEPGSQGRFAKVRKVWLKSLVFT